jgi:uncharacterized protein (TIGR00296 family)
LLDSSIDVGLRDSRFQPVGLEELDKITFGVTVLTPPENINKTNNFTDVLNNIEIGKDGILIKQKSSGRGAIYLPQVATDWNMNRLTFYESLCNKAWIPLRECKNMDDMEVYDFQAEIFKEVKPNGKIIRKSL